MHSFAPSLSFLVSISALALHLAFSSLPVVNAVEISNFANGNAARDIGVGAHNAHRRRHSNIGSAVQHARSTDVMLYPGRRAAGAEFTYFKTGLGACGNFNVPSDFIVALNMEQFDTGKHCGAVITITANGKTARATIQDRCVGCGFNNLDFTEGLYRFFDPTMFGVVHGSWEYGNSGGATKPTTSKKPPPPPPTTTKVHSSTKIRTTSSAKPTPSSSSVVSSSKTQKPSSSAASSASSASATASTTPGAASFSNQNPSGNLANLFGALVGMGGLMINTVPSSA